MFNQQALSQAMSAQPRARTSNGKQAVRHTKVKKIPCCHAVVRLVKRKPKVGVVITAVLVVV
jgi:hypothetical protein